MLCDADEMPAAMPFGRGGANETWTLLGSFATDVSRAVIGSASRPSTGHSVGGRSGTTAATGGRFPDMREDDEVALSFGR